MYEKAKVELNNLRVQTEAVQNEYRYSLFEPDEEGVEDQSMKIQNLQIVR